MRALVAGGAGFVGSHLCERLLTDGDEVVAIDNFITGKPGNVAHLADLPGFSLLEADICADLPVHGRFDVVFNLASPASPPHYLAHPIETLDVGSIGTRATLELARRDGARYLMASTSEVYGEPLVHPQPESYWGNVNPVGPRSVYDEAKRFSEALVAAYRRTYGTDTAIVRIFNTYGPRMRADDGRAIPNFVRQALAGAPVTVAGDGSQTRSICYVSDLVDGLVRMARSDQPGPINIGNQHEVSMLDLARWIIRLTHSDSAIEFIDRPVDDPSVRRPDTTLAHDLLDWRAQVDPEEGLRRTIESVRAEFD